MISLETDDDREDFNIAAAGKNLSRLFDDDLQHADQQSKASLFYRPKQNNQRKSAEPVPADKSRSGSLQSSNPAKLQAFAASAVDVYKLDQGKYIYVGKLGIALMGSSDQQQPPIPNSFRLILYTAKNQPISGATITKTFKFVCQADNYCSFYDDAQQNWSIRFATGDDVTRFTTQIDRAQGNQSKTKKSKAKAVSKEELAVADTSAAAAVETPQAQTAQTKIPSSAETTIPAESTTSSDTTPMPAKRRSNSSTSTSSSSTAPGDSLATRMARMGAQPLFPLLSTATAQKEAVVASPESKTESTSEVEHSTLPAKPTELPLLSRHSEPTIPAKPNKEAPSSFPQNSSTLQHSSFDVQLSSIQSGINELKSLFLNSQRPSLTTSLTMDSALLLNSIQKLITDNETLKSQLTAKSADYDALNGKFIDLLGQKAATSSTPVETPTTSSLPEPTTFALRNDLLAAREEIACLKGDKYSLSMENLRLEKALLESERSVTELTSRLASASRAFKGSLKQTLNGVYSEFGDKLEHEKEKAELSDSSRDSVLQLLSEVLLSVKRQQEGKVREELAGRSEDSSSSLKKSSEVAVKSEDENVKNKDDDADKKV